MLVAELIHDIVDRSQESSSENSINECVSWINKTVVAHACISSIHTISSMIRRRHLYTRFDIYNLKAMYWYR